MSPLHSTFFYTSCVVVLLTVALILPVTILAGDKTAAPPLVWSQLPPLPDAMGFAGSIAGVSNGALIVAGGANFPDAPPWKGGKKVFHDSVFVLEKPDGAWKTGFRLRKPIAYAISLTTPHGILSIGGNDATQTFSDVSLLRWENGSISVNQLPALPVPMTSGGGALIGNTVYIAAGAMAPDGKTAKAGKSFWSMDLSSNDPKWSVLEPWPGPERLNPVAATQDGAFFLVSGIQPNGPGGKTAYLTDAYQYTPATKEKSAAWKRIAELPRPNAAAPSPAPTIGTSQILLLGGAADGRGVDVPMPDRPEFLTECLAYDTRSNTWSALGETPAPRVTTPVVIWNNQIVVPGGEAKPGVRSPEVWTASRQ